MVVCGVSFKKKQQQTATADSNRRQQPRAGPLKKECLCIYRTSIALGLRIICCDVTAVRINIPTHHRYKNYPALFYVLLLCTDHLTSAICIGALNMQDRNPDYDFRQHR